MKIAGANPWIDIENLLPGQHWRDEIKKAIRASRYFITVLSANSVSKRGYVQKEVAEAFDILEEFPESEIFIIPIRLDDCLPAHEKLGELHWANMFPIWENGLAKIISSIKSNDSVSIGSAIEIEKLSTRDSLAPPHTATIIIEAQNSESSTIPRNQTVYRSRSPAIERLDKTQQIIKEAWKGIMGFYKGEQETGEGCWEDIEKDSGFLKDIDALNALIEPYLKTPQTFVELPIENEKVYSILQTILSQQTKAAESGYKKEMQDYRGFTSAPYSYVWINVDFVDSASSFLCLACNVTDLSRVGGKRKKKMSQNLETKLKNSTLKAVDFLLESKVDDCLGVRWQSIKIETNPPGNFANVFFTNHATLSLHRAIQNPMIGRWLDERASEIESVLSRVPQWVGSLYDANSKRYWLDSKRLQIYTATTAYALEILFTLFDALTDEQKTQARIAMNTLAEAIIDDPNSLQTDFFITIPLLVQEGISFYDDRFYVGRLLSLLCLAEEKDPEVVNETFVRAGDMLFRL